MISYFKVLCHKLYYAINYFNRRKVVILSARETIDVLINNRLSICRYGDGELNMVLKYVFQSHYDSGFQNYDDKLASRLLEILQENNDNKNYIVGLPGSAFGLGVSHLIPKVQHLWRVFSNYNVNNLLRVINVKNIYGETNFSRFYLSHKNKRGCGEYVDYVKRIWNNKSILIVEGQYTRLGVNNDLFANCRDVKRILCPATDAFNQYDIIYAQINNYMQFDKSNRLIVLALGMTATVLAYDLSKIGWQAIDVGHIDIEYEWFLRGATEKVAIENKFTNEVQHGNISTELDDAEYLKQIVLKIE